MNVDPDLVDEVAKDKAAANVGVIEEDRDFLAKATKGSLAHRPPELNNFHKIKKKFDPPEYKETKEELEGDPPDNMSPDDSARVTREDEAKGEDDEEAKGGDKSLWLAGSVGKDEDCYRCHHTN